MTWLYVPTCTSSLSALEAADSITASDWRFQALAQSASWRGKPSPPADWFRRWRRADWLQRLCGRMSPPSEAARGVDSWMDSLAESLASRTPWPGSAEDPTTTVTSGQTPDGSSPRSGRGGSSSKTSPGCSRRGLTKSLAPSESEETYERWVTRLREDSSRRLKLASRTSASGSSSSGWPTARVSDTKGADPAREENLSGARHSGDGLATAAALWPSPQSRDHKGVDREHLRDHNARPLNEVAHWRTPNRLDSQGGTRLTSAGQVQLCHQTAKWSDTPTSRPSPSASTRTPATPEASAGLFDTPSARQPDTTTTPASGSMWATPRASEAGADFAKLDRSSTGIALPAQAALWSTPAVADVTGGRTSRSGDRIDEKMLNGQARDVAERWPTPTVPNGGRSNAPGTMGPTGVREDGSKGQVDLSLAARTTSALPLPDQENSTAGEPSSPPDPTSPRPSLNPDFVDWLMGWNVPASTNYGFSEMGSSPWSQAMRSELWRLDLHDAPPEQANLFG